MLAIHDQFSDQMRNRLTTTGMGLGLVQLLQDAKRFEEARTTLYSLENGFQGGTEESGKPSQEPCKQTRLKSVSGAASYSAFPLQVESVGPFHSLLFYRQNV